MIFSLYLLKIVEVMVAGLEELDYHINLFKKNMINTSFQKKRFNKLLSNGFIPTSLFNNNNNSKNN